MSNLIQHNAYRILGLDNSANNREILKRSKEIVNRLKIDDHPEYDLDIKLSNKLRTITSVNDALKQLQSLNESIKEYFFWFQISDAIDEKALNQLKENNIEKAINIWIDGSKRNNSISFFYKKNLAVLYCILLFDKHNNTYLKESISLWYEIINSDKFWSSFSKKYNVYNEQTANSKNIIHLKNNIEGYISDIFTELHQLHDNNKYIKDFQQKFKTHGKQTKKKILNPIYESIYADITILEKIAHFTTKRGNEEDNQEEEELEDKCDNCGSTDAKKYWDYDDQSVLCDKCDKEIGDEWESGFLRIENTIKHIKKYLEKLNKKGLANSSESKIIKDRVAKAIREVSVSLFNTHLEHSEPIKLIEIAQSLCGTQICKDNLSKDLEKLKENKKFDETEFHEVEIPRTFSKDKCTFRPNHIEYKDTKLKYKDIMSVSYHGTGEGNFYFYLSTNDDYINISINTIFTNQDYREEIWLQLISITQQLIEPILVDKLIKQIFEKNMTIKIGDIEFNNEGFSTPKFFGGKNEVLWTDQIYLPVMKEGNIHVFKEKKDSYTHFKQIPMEVKNAVLIPPLIRKILGAEEE
jgi:hypothetical protein